MQYNRVKLLSVCVYTSSAHSVWLVGTESTLGGAGIHKGADSAGGKAETPAGSSSAQKIEKPHEVISFEAAKEVYLQGCVIALATETPVMCLCSRSTLSFSVNVGS